MLVRKVRPHEVEEVIERVSQRDYAGNLYMIGGASVGSGTRFRIGARELDGPGWRYTGTLDRRRRSHNACWYAHRDVLAELFRSYPDAVVTTSLARYAGMEGFLREFPPTGDRNIGSMMSPVTMPEMCGDHCAHERHIPEESMRTDVMRQSDILACPFVIMVPDHYRSDGSCKCTDPEERRRMCEEWDYTPEDFVRAGIIGNTVGAFG